MTVAIYYNWMRVNESQVYTKLIGEDPDRD